MLPVLQELSDSRQERTWLRSGMRSYYRELWDITGRAGVLLFLVQERPRWVEGWEIWG